MVGYVILMVSGHRFLKQVKFEINSGMGYIGFKLVNLISECIIDFKFTYYTRIRVLD